MASPVLALSLAVTGCSGVSGVSGDSGGSVTLVFGHVHSRQDPSSQQLEKMFEAVEQASGGEIVFEVHYDGSLVANQDTLPGVANRRADMTWTTPAYFPSELPLSQAPSLPFLMRTAEEMQEVLDIVVDESPALAAEYEDAGVHLVSFMPNPPTVLAGREPIPSLADMAGLQVRSLGDIGVAVQEAGANAVNLPIQEVYQSLERGLIDAYMGLPMANIPAFSLHEVAPHVVDTGIGTYSTSAVIINLETWNSLSEEHQRIIEDAFRQGSADYVAATAGVEDEACDTILAAGGTFTVWSGEDTEAWREAVGTSAIDRWRSAAESSGADVDSFWASFEAALETVQSGSEPTESGIARCAARS